MAMTDSDDQAPSGPVVEIQPSESIKSLDEEIWKRFSRRTGSIEKFLEDWIKLDESQDRLFGAIGSRGENYFQFILAQNNVEMGLALAKMCQFFAESTSADKVETFLSHTDELGNDLWHYLAGALAVNETDAALQIAKILIQLEIDFCRKNEEDESALSKLLIPEVRWRSINSMNQTRELTIEDLEKSFSDAIGQNEQLKQEIMVNIFTSDLTENEGQLSATLLHHGVSSKTEREERDAIFRLFFRYIGGGRRETVFMKLVEVDFPKLFDQAIDLLIKVADEETKEFAATDINLARAQQQVWLYRLLALQNRGGQSALVKAVIADRPRYVSVISGLLKNENLVIASKDNKGRTVTHDLTVDERSPATQNPSLSMLLQQDGRGNTVYHTAAMLSRVECCKRLFNGLSLMDSFMITTRIPNKFGLTVSDMLDSKVGAQKLGQELKRGNIKQKDAEQLLTLMKKIKRDLKEHLGDMIDRAKETFERTGGLSEAKPTFDLRRIPTISLNFRDR